MGVSNNQAVNAAVTNAAFISKNTNDSMPNLLQLTKPLTLDVTENSSAGGVITPTSSIVRFTSGSAVVLDGATAPATYPNGSLLCVINDTLNKLTIKHENASASADQRFQLPAQTDMFLDVNQGALFAYDANTQRWRALTMGAGPSYCANVSTNVFSYTTTSFNIGINSGTTLIAGTSGVITATLPTAVGATGRQYVIKRTGTGATSYTVNTTSGQTIDGAATYVLAAQYATVVVQSNGTNWSIVAKF